MTSADACGWRPSPARCERDARAGGSGIDDEIRHARMAPGRPELQHFNHPYQRDSDERGHQPVVPVGETEGKPDQDKGKRVFAVLAEIGVRPIARRAERGEGYGGGEAPGNRSKNVVMASHITRKIRGYSAGAKCRGSWLIEMLKAVANTHPVHEPFPNLNRLPRSRGALGLRAENLTPAGGIVNMQRS